MIYNHSATRRNRFPLVAITSDDGYLFYNMLCLSGEVPPLRYQGIHKNNGPQYIRGIVESNGDPPGKYEWITFSVNKEDIWVARIRVPITGEVNQPVKQNFENVENIDELELWNLYVPRWAPVSLVTDPENKANKCLQLRDEEPYDYARVERVFPEAKKVNVQFRVMSRRIGAAVLEVEIYSRHGDRPMRLRFDEDWLSLDRGKAGPDPVAVTLGKWYRIGLKLDCAKQCYDLSVNGKWVRKDVVFAEKVETLERIVFRTGPWRGDVRLAIVDGQPETPGLYQEDLPGADFKVPASVFLIDDVKIF